MSSLRHSEYKDYLKYNPFALGYAAYLQAHNSVQS